MDEPDFVAHLLRCQAPLRALLVGMVGSASAADDCFQEAAAVMTRKRATLPADANFMGWARTVCGFVVRDWRKKQARSRLRTLPDEALEALAVVHAEDDEGGLWEARRRALNGCLGDLEEGKRELLRRRYECDEQVDVIAVGLGRQTGAINTMLCRLRAALADCIGRKLHAAGEA